MAWLITANRTVDGRVVYLRNDFAWTFEIREALWTTDEDERGDLLRWSRAREAEVCDPYTLRVSLTADGPAPTTARERIRAAGPSAALSSLGYA